MKAIALFFAVLFVSFVTVAQTAGDGKIQQSSMQQGRAWTWTYSELQADGSWKPYFSERYTLVAVNGSKLSFEMSSGSLPAPGPGPAHHRFTMDFKDCEKAKGDPRYRGWTVEFWSASSGTWELVSRTHPNLVFSEKFNCYGPAANESLSTADMNLNGELWKTFVIVKKPAGEPSWFFLDHPLLQGVASGKLFEPRRNYKFEFAATTAP